MRKIFKQHGGFTLVEMMVVMLIFSGMMGIVFVSLAASKDAWFTSHTQIQLQENLRQTLERMSTELRETGSDSLGAMQLTISDNTGTNGSDSIRFSIPVICQTGGSIIDANGDVAYWRSALTWGCKDPSCMDADDDCATVDYQFVEYQINASGQLLRRVLNSGAVLVRQDVFASNITDLQLTLSVDQNVLTVTVTADQTTDYNRDMTLNRSMNIRLRNRG